MSRIFLKILHTKKFLEKKITDFSTCKGGKIRLIINECNMSSGKKKLI